MSTKLKNNDKKVSEEGVTRITNVDKEGNEATIRVRKISNGYILTKEQYDPKAKDDCWKTEETFYEQNPLAIPKKTLAEIFQT